MENLVLEVRHENWGLIGLGSWNNTVWKIYEDLSMEVSVLYNLDAEKNFTKKLKISQKDFDYILKLLKESDKVLVDVDGVDGTVWEIKKYQGKRLVWNWDLGYIYGIWPLEAVGRHLYEIAKIKREAD